MREGGARAKGIRESNDRNRVLFPHSQVALRETFPVAQITRDGRGSPTAGTEHSQVQLGNKELGNEENPGGVSDPALQKKHLCHSRKLSGLIPFLASKTELFTRTGGKKMKIFSNSEK